SVTPAGPAGGGAGAARPTAAGRRGASPGGGQSAVAVAGPPRQAPARRALGRHLTHDAPQDPICHRRGNVTAGGGRAGPPQRRRPTVRGPRGCVQGKGSGKGNAPGPSPAGPAPRVSRPPVFTSWASGDVGGGARRHKRGRHAPEGVLPRMGGAGLGIRV